MAQEGFTDSEPETSLNVYKSLHKLSLKDNETNVTRSVFNITFDSSLIDKDTNPDLNYETRLHQEIKEWGSLFRNELQSIKTVKGEQRTVDTSILAEDKRMYLEDAPDIKRFLRESKAFREVANIYLEKNYAEVKAINDNLIEICQHRNNLAKHNKIMKNLSLDPYKNIRL